MFNVIDVLKAKQYFKQYSLNYDFNEPRIQLKAIHMQHVAENARMIAKSLGLSEEQQDLAELIGLLHDIGRFDQWKLYGTYSDKLSIDHGQKSVEVLFGDKHIRGFVADEKYDNVIYKAILNHNKVEIQKGLNEQELLYSKIVRDSDNLDIFRSLLEGKIEDHSHFGSQDIAQEVLSVGIFEEFKKEKLMLYTQAKNDMDAMVTIIAHIYAINFKQTFEKLKQSDYVCKFVRKINAQDQFTKEKLDQIADYAMDYMERKIKS